MEPESLKWADDPIRAKDSDRLSRGDYATRIAHSIDRQSSHSNSAIFGLVGPWGSGKTSLINMIENELTRQGDQWKVARFTPWATGDTTSLIQEFYSSISSELPDEGKIKDKLLTLAQIAAPAATLIPIVGTSAKQTADALVEHWAAKKPWDETFDAVSKSLSDMSWRLLVIVDDIDRLQPDELLTLLKVVRLLGRFPGVQYLLAYDRKTVEGVLKSIGADSGAPGLPGQFMEKIVQYPFAVPPFGHDDRATLLEDSLERLMSPRGSFTDKDQRLRQAFQIVLGGVDTPRALSRFVASLARGLDVHIAGEVNDVDVLLLTYVRLRHPDLHEAIFRNRKELTSHQARDGGDALLKNLGVTADDEDWSEVVGILNVLFPDSMRGKGVAGLPLWSSPYNGIQSAEYLDRYFQMGIPSKDVADALVLTALREAGGGDASRLEKLFTEGNRLPPRVVARKIAALKERVELPTQQSLHRLVLALAEFRAEVSDDGGSLMGPRDMLSDTMAWLLSSADENTPVQHLLPAFARLHSIEDRFFVLRDVQAQFQKAPDKSAPEWLHQLTETLRKEAEDEAANRLLNFNRASEGSGLVMLTSFLSHTGGHEDLTERLRVHYEEGMFTPGQLAALMVPTMTRLGADPVEMLSEDIPADSIRALAPWADFSGLNGPPLDVSRTDLSWGNRETYVFGRMSPQ